MGFPWACLKTTEAYLRLPRAGPRPLSECLRLSKGCLCPPKACLELPRSVLMCHIDDCLKDLQKKNLGNSLNNKLFASSFGHFGHYFLFLDVPTDRQSIL